MANALGIDYGRRRMGLSFADELGVAFPLDAVPGVDEPGCFDALAARSVVKTNPKATRRRRMAR